MGAEFRVLHVDDDASFADLVADFLERADSRLRVVTESCPRDALDRLDSAPVDAIVSDYQMPEMDGLSFLDAVRDGHPDLPFVLFTGQGSEEIASEAIARGVTDYLQKGRGTDQYTVLANRLTNAIERTEMAATLRRREAHLRQAQQVATIGSWWRDSQSDDLYWSDEVYEIFGIPASESLDHETFLSAIHPDDRAFVEEKWTAALAGEPYDIEHRIVVDGETKWVREQAEIEFGADGDPVRATGVVQDITDRKERQRRLHETNRQFQAVLDTVEAAIFTKGTDGTYRLVNDTARAIMDVEKGGAVGRTDHDIFPDDIAEEFRADDQRVVDTGEVVRREVTVPRAEGTRTYLTVKSPIVDENGNVTGICAVATDVTGGVE